MSRSVVKFEADYWRAKARHIRDLAKETLDPHARAVMLRLAADYCSIAVRAEARVEADRTEMDAA